MSVYFQKDRGWRFEFQIDNKRYTGTNHKLKRDAKAEEIKRREEIKNIQKMPTDMDFLNLVNYRLDDLKAYDTPKHYKDMFYLARGWIKQWNGYLCSEITKDMIQDFLKIRLNVSPITANKELRCLRATFNAGLKNGKISINPTKGIEFFPIEKKEKYVPPICDVDKVIDAAKPEDQDYLWTIRETMGRMSEINRLTWDDVNFQLKCVTLYTRKKKGGDLTPRRVAMTTKLHGILCRRFQERDETKPWVFWHRYRSKKAEKLKENKGKKVFVEGPYLDRKGLMRSLCKKVGVRYFRYHAMRHAGASIMDNNNVPTIAIQKILGHEQRSTTDIYLHSLGGVEIEAIAAYEKARENPTQQPHAE